MNSNSRLLAAAITIVALVAGCASTKPTSSGGVDFENVRSQVERLLSRSDLSNAVWGVRVLRLDTGAELYSRNENTSLVPASNTKLYTTAASIDQLGGEFRFRTAVNTNGSINSGVLDGDLIVVGSGDPSIGGRFHDGDPTAIFREWANTLRALGITRISGNIVGDDNLFDDLPLGHGWSWDDEVFWYSAEVGALTFNDNCIDVTISASAVGGHADVTWEPANTSFVEIINRTQTVATEEEEKEKFERARGSNIFVVASRVKSGTSTTESLAITNPTAFFVSVLRDVLVENGIDVDGYPVDIDDYTVGAVDSGQVSGLFIHESPTLAELSNVLNKRSHNLYAEQFLRVLGTEVGHDTTDASTANIGIDAAARTWSAAGIDTSRIQIVDGSGLSRYNLVTVSMTSKLLQYMWGLSDTDRRDAFLASLSVGGVDGTIAGRFTSPEMIGRVRAKTGTVSNVSSLSGYVSTDAGVPLAFAIMANHFTVETDTVRAVQDAIVTLFARSNLR